MEIYILRHGIAAAAQKGAADSERPLTEEGKQKLGAVLERAAGAGVKPSVILTSPYRRARETADIAAKALKCNKVVDTEALTPGHTPEDVWKAIRQQKSMDVVLLAGHDPLLSQTVAFLLGAPDLQVDLKKGAMVRVDQETLRGEPRAILKWMLTPRLV
jgi:phosphohistidine phosphatase